MFKLVVLSVFIAVATAKPGLILDTPLLKTAVIAEPSHVAVHEPTIAQVGEVVQSVPTAVSHQSSTVIHSKANVVTPIVAPAVNTYAAPIVKTVAAAPVLSAYAAAPVISSYAAAPVLNSYAASAPLLKSYTSGPLYAGAGALTYARAAPLAYASPLAYSAPLAYAHSAPVLKSYAGPLGYSAAHLGYSAPIVHAW